MLITILIPCYNSSKTIKSVVRDIKTAFSQQDKYDYQVVLVNDNSPDNTFDVINEICKCDSKIIGVDLSKNYGQESALMAALSFVNGDIAIFMDDDGQHSPFDIFKLIDKINEGNDVVYANFPNKKHSLFKKATSKLYSLVLEASSRKPKGIYISSFFAINKMAIDSLKKYKSPFPSIGGYLFQITRKFANVELEHKERLEGESNYSLSKLIKLAVQGITNFSITPLRVSSIIGLISAFIGFIIAFVYIIMKFINPHTLSGFTANISATLFIGGLIMFMLGIMGEYLGRIYILLSNMPQYNVRQIINNEESENAIENKLER